MNCLYIHNRSIQGPKESTWFAFHYLTKELIHRGHNVKMLSVDYNMTSNQGEHWTDQDLKKIDMLFTVHTAAEGPLKVARLKQIPSFMEIGFACPEVAMSFIKQELAKANLPTSEIRGDMLCLGKHIYDLPSYIVGVGNKNYTLKSYLKFGVKNVKLFKLGIDYDKYTPDFNNRHKEKIRFTFTAGLLTFRKGVYYLVNAWRHLPPHYQDKIELHIVGLTIKELRTKQMIDDLVREYRNVVNHGYVYNQSLQYKAIHAVADAMILPTLAEGQAATVLEGLSFGLFPIVSPFTGTNIKEFPSYELSQNPSLWIKELGEGIKTVVDNYDYITRVRKIIRQKICDEYKWSDFARKEIDFIENVYSKYNL